MFQFSLNCTEALIYSRDAYEELYTFYDELESEADRQRDQANTERFKRLEIEEKLQLENKRKRGWRKAALIEGSILGAIVAAMILL